MDVVKAELRRALRAARRGLDPARRADLGAALRARLADAVPADGRIFAFVPMDDEPPLLPLLAAWLADGRQVAVPRIEGDDLLPCPLASLDALVPGRFGIPTSDAPPWDGAGITITPGLGFDLRGGRLGLGRGFYDRWFARAQTLAIAVAWDEQVVPEIPMEAHDRRIDVLVTPTRTIHVGRERP